MNKKQVHELIEITIKPFVEGEAYITLHKEIYGLIYMIKNDSGLEPRKGKRGTKTASIN